MKIFCDFDGTVAKNDVGSLLFKTFADNRCYEIVKQWKEGKISARECLIAECRITRVTKLELEKFVDTQALDTFFIDFYEYCKAQNMEIEIVSDGLDFYINRMLTNHGLISSVTIRSNRLVFLNQTQIRPEFPYFEKGCGRCGNCKGIHVRQARSFGHPVIYIGDGLSDRCGAKEADLVFAKRDRELLAYCRQKQIPHSEFYDFRDVLNGLKKMIASKSIQRIT
ncbi:MAG: MtnX-like HAD-IB family phosphatase [bacterium]